MEPLMFRLNHPAGLPAFLEISNTLNITNTIELAEVRVKIEVLVVLAVLFCQLQFYPAGCHPVYWVELGEGFLKPQQILTGEFAANIDILRYSGSTMRDSRKAADDNEPNLTTVQFR